MLFRSKAFPNAEVHATVVAPSFSRWELLSQRLLSAALSRNDFGIVYDHVVHLVPDCQKIFEGVRHGERKLADPALDELLNLIILQSAPADIAEIEEVKSHLVREYYKERRRELTIQVQQAELRSDDKGVASALQELGQLPIF